MLMLSRRVGEKIVIGEGANTITLVVVEIDRGKVRLALEAPKHIRIMRSELINEEANHDRRGVDW